MHEYTGKLKIISDACIFEQQEFLSDPPQLMQLQTDLDVVLPIQHCSCIDPYTYAVK